MNQIKLYLIVCLGLCFNISFFKVKYLIPVKNQSKNETIALINHNSEFHTSTKFAIIKANRNDVIISSKICKTFIEALANAFN
jgi:hypothetical protein